jgi:hypothetical protein
MNETQRDNLYLLILTIITLPVTLYSYLMGLFSVNIHTYFGAAKLTDFWGAFPSNVDMSWETRPLLNRIIFYGLYKIFETLKDNELLFQIGTKATVAVAILCVCAYLAREVCKKCEHLNVYAVFLISTLSLFTLHCVCLMEPEFFAVIGSFLAIALLLSESRWANGVAGVVMVGVFLLKGLTGVMIPVIVISCFLFDKENILKKLKYVLTGFVLSGIVFIISCLLWFPHVIPDILYSVDTVNPAGNGLVERIYWLIIASSIPLRYIPIMCAGVFAFVYLIWDYIKSKEYILAAVLATSWVFSTTLVLIQGAFTANHFALLVTPAVICILLFLSTRYRGKIITGVLIVMGITLCIWFTTSSVWANDKDTTWLRDTTPQRITEANTIKQTYIPDSGEPVLYIDCDSPYFLGNPTACRHTTAPTMLLASKMNRDIINTQAYKEDMACIMNYSGDHIILNTGWFGVNEPANTKIANEYRLVYMGEIWNVYEKR